MTIRVAPRDHAFLARFRPDLLRIEGVKEVVIDRDISLFRELPRTSADGTVAPMR